MIDGAVLLDRCSLPDFIVWGALSGPRSADAEAVHAKIVASIGQTVPESTCEGAEAEVQKPSGLPCNFALCQQICTPQTVYLSQGKYKIPYQENVCVDDKACLDKNAACHAKLIGIMKEAQDAEVSLKSAVANKNQKKGDHAAATAAKNAAAAEVVAAKKAMDAARAAFEEEERVAAGTPAPSATRTGLDFFPDSDEECWCPRKPDKSFCNRRG